MTPVPSTTPTPRYTVTPIPTATPTPPYPHTPTPTATQSPTATPIPPYTPTPIPPSPPTGLGVYNGMDYLELVWNPNPEPDISGYNVYRSLTAEGEFTLLNQELVKETGYTDSGLGHEEVYYYKVSALNTDFNESEKSGYVRGMVGAITAWMPDYRGDAGDEVTLLINAANAVGISNYGLDVQFTYDTELLTPINQIDPERVTVERTALTEGFMIMDNSEFASGQLNISGIGPQGMTIVGEGHLFDIKFKVSEGASPFEACEHLFVVVKFKDENGENLLVDYSDRSLFTVAPDYILGDINGDGEVDSGDALLALKIATGELIPTELQKLAGDLNGDRKIDSADAVMILRKAVGLPVNPPQAGGGSLARSVGEYTVAISDGRSLPGQVVQIPVSINSVTDLAGLDLSLSYDPAVLTVLSVEKTELTGSFTLDYYSRAGELNLAISSDQALSGGGGALLKVEFQVMTEATIGSDCDLNLEGIKLSGRYGEDLAWYSNILTEAGKFTVGATPPPTPTATPTPLLTPTPRYTVTPIPPATPTPRYTPTPTPVITPTPTIIKCFQVAGRVIDRNTRAPMAGAAVRIVCPDGRSGVGKANGSGQYDLEICTHFEDGTVRAQARYRGYLPGYADASYLNWADEGVVEMGDIELNMDSIYSGGIVSGDYDGDGLSDIAIFRPASGLWAIRGISRLYFGGEGDELIPADYDGDGTADISVFRAASGLWAIRGLSRIYYGSFEDIPVPGDYGGSGTANIGIFRGASGLWAIRSVTRAYFGGRYDQPAPGDYDGDGSLDTAIFRSSSGLWAMRGLSRFYFGNGSDRLVPGDYDGLGYRAAGIFRQSSGLWAIKGVTRVYYGGAGDLPVPGDYSGIGGDDIGIFRPGSGLWAIRGVTRAYYGGSNDIPVTR